MNVSVKIQAQGQLDNVYNKVSEALKVEGFGILTRIDFHDKIQEKLGKAIPKTIILGSCHPGLAFDAFMINPGVANLMPCNVVLQEVSKDQWTVEFALAEPILSILNDSKLQEFAKGVDKKIKAAAQAIG
jgi:uncharacterized protein (DUF302 family)